MRRLLSTALMFLLLVTGQAQVPPSDLTISFVYPTNNSTVPAPLFLRVNITDTNATVVSVEYFAGSNSLGIVSNSPIIDPPGPVPQTVTTSAIALPIFYSPFMFYWDPTAGDYVLTAKATDSAGNTALSDPVSVTVIPTPVVTVEATQSAASPGNPGVFTISRTGETNADLQVAFFLAGTAQNGLDYSFVSNSVTLPAGQSFAEVTISPLSRPIAITRTVILTLEEIAVPEALIPNNPSGNPAIFFPFEPPYQIGSPSQAVIDIKPSVRRLHEPFVRFIQPRNRQLFPLGSTVPITALTLDRFATVTNVAFFDGTNQIGQTQNSNSQPVTSASSALVPFHFTWTNAAIGIHILTAQATDNLNQSQISPPVKIRVLPAP